MSPPSKPWPAHRIARVFCALVIVVAFAVVGKVHALALHSRVGMSGEVNRYRPIHPPIARSTITAL
jgi:hypothetical protein